MGRVIWLVMDSFGIGGAEDAASFGDEGADTLGHINDAYPLSLPTMASLGLVKAYETSTGNELRLLQSAEPVKGSFYGAARSRVPAKIPSLGTGRWQGCRWIWRWSIFLIHIRPFRLR